MVPILSAQLADRVGAPLRPFVLIAALALASLAGCGEDGSSGTDATSPTGGGLTMTREDGSTVSFDDLEVSCGPSVFTGSGEEAIVIGQQEPPTSEPTEPVLTIEGILEESRRVRRPRRCRTPTSTPIPRAPRCSGLHR